MRRLHKGLLIVAGGMFSLAAAFAQEPATDIEVVVVVGAPGEEEYGERFAAMEALWRKRCGEGGAGYLSIGIDQNEGEQTDFERLRDELKERSGNKTGELWLVLIGHGTFDGRKANFNLRGSDLSATQLRDWLAPKKEGVVLINAASSSSPFLNIISGPGRIVITATKSGSEVFYPEFGEQFAKALASKDADLDEDGQTSLLETFLRASRAVASDYEESGLLATEHALIDDNGDGKGTRADWYQGVKVLKQAEGKGVPDGMRAHQRHLVPSDLERRMPVELRRKRDEIELEVSALRYKKGEVPEEEYYRRLERLFLRIAEIYREAEARAEAGS